MPNAGHSHDFPDFIRTVVRAKIEIVNDTGWHACTDSRYSKASNDMTAHLPISGPGPGWDSVISSGAA